MPNQSRGRGRGGYNFVPRNNQNTRIQGVSSTPGNPNQGNPNQGLEGNQVGTSSRSFADALQGKKPKLAASKIVVNDLPEPVQANGKTRIKLFAEGLGRGKNYVKYSLIARVDFKTLTFDEVKISLKQQWELTGSVSFIPMQKGYFLIRLTNINDKNKIWRQGPWWIPCIIDGIQSDQLVKIQEWNKFFVPDNQKTVNAATWCRLPGLGLECWEEDVLMGIGKGLGNPIAVDPKTLSREMGYFAAILVDIDYSKPLVKELELEDEEGTVFVQKIVYPWPVKFCKFCGIIGHLEKECRVWNYEDAKALAISESDEEKRKARLEEVEQRRIAGLDDGTKEADSAPTGAKEADNSAPNGTHADTRGLPTQKAGVSDSNVQPAGGNTTIASAGTEAQLTNATSGVTNTPEFSTVLSFEELAQRNAIAIQEREAKKMEIMRMQAEQRKFQEQIAKEVKKNEDKIARYKKHNEELAFQIQKLTDQTTSSIDQLVSRSEVESKSMNDVTGEDQNLVESNKIDSNVATFVATTDNPVPPEIPQSGDVQNTESSCHPGSGGDKNQESDTAAVPLASTRTASSEKVGGITSVPSKEITAPLVSADNIAVIAHSIQNAAIAYVNSAEAESPEIVPDNTGPQNSGSERMRENLLQLELMAQAELEKSNKLREDLRILEDNQRILEARLQEEDNSVPAATKDMPPPKDVPPSNRPPKTGKKKKDGTKSGAKSDGEVSAKKNKTRTRTRTKAAVAKTDGTKTDTGPTDNEGDTELTEVEDGGRRKPITTKSSKPK